MIEFVKYQQEDFEKYYYLVSNFNAMNRIGEQVYSRDEALIKFLHLLDQDVYRIVKDGQDLGLAKLIITNDEGEIGYLLLPEYWNQEYENNIVAKLVAIARDYELTTVYNLIDPTDELLYQALIENGFVIIEPEMSEGQAKIRLNLILLR